MNRVTLCLFMILVPGFAGAQPSFRPGAGNLGHVQMLNDLSQLTPLGQLAFPGLGRHSGDDVEYRLWRRGGLTEFRAHIFRRIDGVWEGYRLETELKLVAASDSQAMEDGLLKPEMLATLGEQCLLEPRRTMGKGPESGQAVGTVYQLICPNVVPLEGVSQEVMAENWEKLLAAGIDRLPTSNNRQGIDGRSFMLEFYGRDGYRFSRVWSGGPFTEETLGDFHGVYTVLAAYIGS